MIILVDQDGPLADFEGEFLKRWRHQFPDEPYIPLAERKASHVRDDYPPYLIAKVQSIYCASGFFSDLSPVQGGCEALEDMVAHGHTVFICTSPISQYEHCVKEKYEWVERHLGRAWTRKVILTKDKTMVRGDILIDDWPVIEGCTTPIWQHVLFDHPYNRHVQQKFRLLSWVHWRALGYRV